MTDGCKDCESRRQLLGAGMTRHGFLGLAASGLTLAAVNPLDVLAAKKCKYGTMTVTKIVNGKKKKVKVCRPAPKTPTATPTETPTATPRPLTIREVATERGIEVGVATGISGIGVQGSPYPQTLADNFNMGLIADVTMVDVDSRFPDFWTAPNVHNFGFVDEEVAFLRDHGLSIYWEPVLDGTNLVADWLKKGTFSPDQMRSIIQDHITAVVSRYKGDIHHWNVVTEPVPEGWIGEDPFSKVLGDGYIDLAFETARMIDPTAVLSFVDDSSTTPSDGKYQWDLQTVRRLRNKTVSVNGQIYPLIDRMNLECYIGVMNPPEPEDLGAAVEGFKQLGVDVQVDITVAIDDPAGPSEATLAKQADLYRMAMTAYLQHGVKTFIVWGLHDPGSYPVGTHAALFDDRFQPKPAYYAVLDVLKNWHS